MSALSEMTRTQFEQALMPLDISELDHALLLAHDAALREHIARLTQERDSFQRLAQFNEQTYQATLARMEGERDDLKRKYDLVRFDDDYRRCCELREQAEQERDDLKKMDRLQLEEIARLEQDNTRLRADCDTWYKTVTERTIVMDQQQKQLSTLNSELGKWKALVEQRDQLIVQLDSRIERLSYWLHLAIEPAIEWLNECSDTEGTIAELQQAQQALHTLSTGLSDKPLNSE